jgi:NADH-quinone oxidoreductase E subunit
MALQFGEDTKKEIEARLERLPERHSLLIPLLHMAQREFGYVSQEAMEYISKEYEFDVAEVRAVATFYTMFNKKSVGKFHVQVCQNLSCSMLGAESLIEHLEKKLAIEVGETTEDGMFTLSRVECLGSCGTAPVMQVNDDYYENLTPEKVDQIIDDLKKED